MRILLVAPSRRDPAHRRVLHAMRRELIARGDTVRVFPPLRPPAHLREELRRLLDWAEVCHIQFFSRGLPFLRNLPLPDRTRLVLTNQGASLRLLDDAALFRRIARRADVVTAVSRAGLAELSRALPSIRRKSVYVPNGADSQATALCGPRARRPFALCVGRLAAYKGIDLLLMAFARIERDHPELDLVICGPDQTGGRLPRFALALGLKRRVRFLGETSPRRVWSLLRACAFFVLPSREENLPMALLEAMAAGKAAVAADAGGVRELIAQGVSGMLVPRNDVPALERALSRLAQDRRLRERLGANARRRSRPFRWSAVAAAYRRLYSGN